MPSIIAIPFPTRGQVLLEINFGDVPSATNVCVEAVTGLGTTAEKRRSLHPYVSYNGDGCLALSCGQAVMWDTEVACDVPTVWCATAVNALGAVVTTAPNLLFNDTFSRAVVNGWGTADSGQLWTVSGGATADYSVNTLRGFQSLTSTAVIRSSTLASSHTNPVVHTMMSPGVVALTSAIEGHVAVRVNGNNDYRAMVSFGLAGAMTLNLQRNVAGVITTLATTPLPGTYTAATIMEVVISAWGPQLQATAWDSTTPQPPVQLTASDSTFTTNGTVALRSQRLAGNTNGTVAFFYDNFYGWGNCATNPTVAICTEPFTIACDGCFRLGDPVRPCNDIKVCDCADVITCGATGGVFFAGMTADTYAANSGRLIPTNAVNPIPISRNRRSPSGELDVVATSFTARDQLLTLLAPGSVLFWRGPAASGIGDRYLDFGDIAVAPQLADLTSQPRLMPLPFQQVAAPTGPTQGVCGARVRDLCQVYTSWDALTAAGLTYADLLRGNASTTPAGLATWNDINAQNASWNVLLVNEPIWSDVVDGD